jgi:hypothetical protein
VFGFGPGDGRDAILDFVTGGSEADVIAFNGGAPAPPERLSSSSPPNSRSSPSWP